MSGSAIADGDMAQAIVLGLGLIVVLILVAAAVLASASAVHRLLATWGLFREFMAWRRDGRPERKQVRMEERRRCADVALRVARELETLTNPRTRGAASLDDVNIALAARGTALRIADTILAETHRAGTAERVA